MIGHPPDLVHRDLNLLLTNGVVTPGVVVGSILLASDQLLGVEELPVGSHFDLVHHGGLQIDQDRPGDVFPGARLREESVEAVVRHTQRGVGRHQTVRVDPVLQAVQFPAVLVCQLQLTINGQFLST